VKPEARSARPSLIMRLAIALALGVICAAQTVKIPPVKTSVNLEGQPVEVTVWGTLSGTGSDHAPFSVTADLADLQDKLTAVLAAQLNRSERCGERLSVERASLAPTGLLTANVHYERFGCAKAFGKDMVKRLVGGNAVVEVNLTPSIAENRIVLAGEVRKIDADGSLGQALHSGSVGDSLRDKIAASIQSAIQKATNLKSALPGGMESAAELRTVKFEDGGNGRLWLTAAGEVRLPAEELRRMK